MNHSRFAHLTHIFTACLFVLFLTHTSLAQSTQNVNRKFAKKVTVVAEEEPMVAFIQRISKEHGIKLVIDEAALEDEGLENETVSFNLNDVSLLTVLDLAAETHQCVCIPQGVQVHLTTRIAMQEKLVEREYRIPWVARMNLDIRSIAEPLEYPSGGSWVDYDPGGGAFTAFTPTSFRVNQNWETHQEISFILTQIQSIVSGRGPFRGHPGELKVQKQLQEQVELAASEKPLSEFLGELQQGHKINFWIDRFEFETEGISIDLPLTLSGGKKQIGKHLQEALEGTSITMFVDGEVVKLTTEPALENYQVVRVYDVRKQIRKVGSASNVIDVLYQNEEAGPWFEIDSIGGRCEEFGPLLVIRHTRQKHAIVAEMLK